MHKTPAQWSKVQPAGTVARWSLDLSLLVTAMEDIEEIGNLLEELDEFLDGQADADMDQDGYVPNRAMQLLVAIRAITKGSAY